jgi:hypothetical protein
MEEGKRIRRVWDHRFLAPAVVVPPSMTERLNTVLALFEMKLRRRADVLSSGTDC